MIPEPERLGEEARHTEAEPSALADLLARVEAAGADDQWGLIREAGKLLIPLDPWRAQLNALCDAGGFTDAAMALCERVLPGAAGWLWVVQGPDGDDGPFAQVLGPARMVKLDWDGPLERDRDDWSAFAKTPALALLAALLKARIAQAASPAERQT